MKENYNALLSTVLKGQGVEHAVELALLEEFCDWQWNEYLSVQVPQEYLDEVNFFVTSDMISRRRMWS